MLVAVFYPLLDGGIQQMAAVYRGLARRQKFPEEARDANEKGDDSTSPSTPSAESISDAAGNKEPKDEGNR